MTTVYLPVDIDGVPHTAAANVRRGYRATHDDPGELDALEDITVTVDSTDEDVTALLPQEHLDRIDEAFHDGATYLQLDAEDLVETSFTDPDT